MSLLVDKYRPNDLAALSFWPEETDLIRSLVQSKFKRYCSIG